MVKDAPAIVVALFTQALLYGLYLATLGYCLRWLLYQDEGWKPRGEINRDMSITTISIFLLSTTKLGLTLRLVLYTVGQRKLATNAASVITRDGSEAALFLIVDIVSIYRCWIVYGKSLPMILPPVIIWIGCAASLCLSIYYDYRDVLSYQGEQSLWWFTQQSRSLIATQSCNIATNLYATVAITLRILSVVRTSGNSSRRLKRTILILAESGILYGTMTVFALIGNVLGVIMGWEPVVWIVFTASDAMNFSMAGISFNLILVRVYSARSDHTDSSIDSKNVITQTLSGIQFDPSRPTVTVESQLSQASTNYSVLVSIVARITLQSSTFKR